MPKKAKPKAKKKDFAPGLESLSPEIRKRISDGDHSAMTAASDHFGEEKEYYLAFIFACAALDHGDPEGEDSIDFFFTAEIVCDEDVLLAYYQLARWYAAGQYLPSNHELSKGCIDEIIGGLEEPPDLDSLSISEALDKLGDFLGLPKGLDYSISLGPSMPNTPCNIHRRHLEE